MSEIKTLNGHNLVDTAATAKLNRIIETVGGDTLTWDGSYDESLLIGGTLYKISDATPSDDELGIGTIFMSGLTVNLTTVAADESGNVSAVIASDTQCLAVIRTDNCELEGIVVEEAGIYALPVIFGNSISLTIPGYTGFTTDKLKPEALPDSVNDWNQMQNKPFYSEQVKNTVVNETTLQVDPDMGSFVVPYVEPLEDGGTYIVNYNGTEYTAVAKSAMIDGTAAIIIGNTEIMDGTPSNDEPFLIALFVENDEKVLMLMDLNGATEATVSIRGDFERVKKIDDKFINTPTHTIFYVDITNAVSNPYLYHDTELTTKVTSNELFEALLYGSLVIMHRAMAARYVYYPMRVLDMHVEICIEPLGDKRQPSYISFYTAEYTPT